MLKNCLKVFIKSYFSAIIALVMILLSFINGYNQFGNYENSGVLEKLNGVLFFSIYLYIVSIFLSNEFMRKLRAEGICDVCWCTKRGYKGKHLTMGFVVLTIWSLLCTISCMAGFFICMGQNNVVLPDNRFYIHVVLSLVLNVFFVMELAIILGITLSALNNRIVSYMLSFLMIFLVSPYFIQIATMVCLENRKGGFVYTIAEFFNVLPLCDEHMDPIYSFADSVIPYRWCIIIFLGSVSLLILFLCQAKRRKKAVLALIACILSGVIVFGDSCKVNMNFNPSNTRMCEQYEYFVKESPYGNTIKDEKPDYKIKKYDMDLTICINLKAKVTMTMNKYLSEYKMSLFHGYKVSKVTDEKGDKLKFNQKNDYILVENSDENKIINVEYSGSSPKYYSNVQGTYLPGYFCYYPRAGYIPVFDLDYVSMKQNFVDKNTKFNLKINSIFEIYTNLPKTDDGYKGQCDGVTILSGYYKEQDLGNGNNVVYPYLLPYEDYFNPDEAEDPDKEVKKIIASKDSVKEKSKQYFFYCMKECLKSYDKDDTTIFVVPSVNQLGDYEIYGENQVFVNEGGVF